MITSTLTKLTADNGKLLTDGTQFLKAIILRDGQSPEEWQEITESDYKRLQAKMTPREFILALMGKGITRTQLQDLIDANDQVWAELNYATLISRANPLLDQLCSQFGLTPADVDKIFGLN